MYVGVGVPILLNKHLVASRASGWKCKTKHSMSRPREDWTWSVDILKFILVPKHEQRSSSSLIHAKRKATERLVLAHKSPDKTCQDINIYSIFWSSLVTSNWFPYSALRNVLCCEGIRWAQKNMMRHLINQQPHLATKWSMGCVSVSKRGNNIKNPNILSKSFNKFKTTYYIPSKTLIHLLSLTHSYSVSKLSLLKRMLWSQPLRQG